MSGAKYSAEQLAFLKNTYQLHNAVETTALFNEKFNQDKTVGKIKACFKNHGITCGRTGHFTKGGESWNKGMKGLDLGGRSHETRFKKGDKPKNLREIGSERICKKDGYILIKVNEKNPHTNALTRFKHKQIVVWEQHHGRIPEGHIVRFLDGNKLNCEPDNLTLVSMALHLHLNRFGYNDYPDELKESAMALCKLETAYFAAIKRAE
jgi:hypothetical protein